MRGKHGARPEDDRATPHRNQNERGRHRGPTRGEGRTSTRRVPSALQGSIGQGRVVRTPSTEGECNPDGRFSWLISLISSCARYHAGSLPRSSNQNHVVCWLIGTSRPSGVLTFTLEYASPIGR